MIWRPGDLAIWSGGELARRCALCAPRPRASSRYLRTAHRMLARAVRREAAKMARSSLASARSRFAVSRSPTPARKANSSQNTASSASSTTIPSLATNSAWSVPERLPGSLPRSPWRSPPTALLVPVPRWLCARPWQSRTPPPRTPDSVPPALPCPRRLDIALHLPRPRGRRRARANAGEGAKAPEGPTAPDRQINRHVSRSAVHITRSPNPQITR